MTCATSSIALVAPLAGCVSDDNAAPPACGPSTRCADASLGDDGGGTDAASQPDSSVSEADGATGADAAPVGDGGDAGAIDAAPNPIVSKLVSPVTLVHAGGYLYWRSAHQPQVPTNDVVGVYEIATGKTTTIQDPYSVDYLYSDGTYVYWLDAITDVYRLTPGAAAPVKIGTQVANNYARGMTADGKKLYWSENAQTGQVRSIPIDAGGVDGGATAPTFETPPLKLPTGLVAVGGNVFLAIDTTDGGIVSLAPDGGAPSPAIAHRDSPTTLTSDGKNLVWIETQGGNDVLVSAPVAGGTVTTYAPATASRADLAIDGSTAYWIGASYHTIEKATLGDPASHQTVVTASYTIESLTTVGPLVYWLDVDDGVVYSAPK